MKGDAELAAFIAAVQGDDELEVAVGEAWGRFRRRQDQAIRDQEAADLLPHLGAEGVAEKQGCDRVTVYRRAKRALRRRIVAPFLPIATPA